MPYDGACLYFGDAFAIGITIAPATLILGTTACSKADNKAENDSPETLPALLAAFKKVEADYAPTKGFSNLLCHDSYATGLQQLVTEGSAEPATVLFKYTASTKSWAVVTARPIQTRDLGLPLTL